jgi:hypothetical protein
VNDLKTAIERGTRAWADVPDASAWVEELRGNDTPEVTPDVDNVYTKLDTSDRVLHKEWVGLTDEERSKIWGELPQTSNEERDACIFAQAIEAKLKQKNVPQP